MLQVDKPQQKTDVPPHKRYRVLISAYSVAPHRGSEPAVGWNVVREMCKYHDVWVLTRRDRGELIEPEVLENPLPNVRWVYHELPYWARFWRKGTRGQRIHYYMWQITASLIARRLHKKINFDLVHHVTYVKYWAPSFVSGLKIPFVWGPVGGGESMPKSFYSNLSFKGKLYEYIRDVTRFIGHHDPFVRMTAKNADVALATTQETAERLHDLGSKHVEIMPAIGLPEEELTQLRPVTTNQHDSIRFLSLGRLLDWKGFHFGLQAFARFHKDFPNSEYWIIGDGPQRNYLETMVDDLGIREKVRFLGKLPRHEVLERFADVDVLVHPSLHESGGGVCLEAMAVGRPVICLKLGGPAELVSDETGFRIEATTPDQTINDLAVAMGRLASAPELLQQMGVAARKRVDEHFSWESKGHYFANLYEKLMGEQA